VPEEIMEDDLKAQRYKADVIGKGDDVTYEELGFCLRRCGVPHGTTDAGRRGKNVGCPINGLLNHPGGGLGSGVAYYSGSK
jgi:hypothetical protein